MAPGRRALGGLTTVAVVLALAVTGCGGGDSSAPGTASTGATDGAAAVDVEAQGNSPASDGGESSAQKGEPAANGKQASGEATGASGKKKHAPLQLPTGKPEEGATPEQIEAVPTADIAVTVPGGLTAANTCNGKELSPTVKWRNVPPDTAELALFVMPLKPVPGSSSPLYFDWAVAGIDPSLGELKAGEVPQGAVVGRNSAGKNAWDLCPQGSAPENYIFALYALPESLGPKAGFDPLELRKEATAASDNVGLYSVTF